MKWFMQYMQERSTEYRYIHLHVYTNILPEISFVCVRGVLDEHENFVRMPVFPVFCPNGPSDTRDNCYFEMSFVSII